MVCDDRDRNTIEITAFVYLRREEFTRRLVAIQAGGPIGISRRKFRARGRVVVLCIVVGGHRIIVL